MKAALRAQHDRIVALEQQIQDLTETAPPDSRYSAKRRESERLANALERRRLRDRCEQLASELALAEEKILRLEKDLREAHTIIQELRGSPPRDRRRRAGAYWQDVRLAPDDANDPGEAYGTTPPDARRRNGVPEAVDSFIRRQVLS